MLEELELQMNMNRPYGDTLNIQDDPETVGVPVTSPSIRTKSAKRHGETKQVCQYRMHFTAVSYAVVQHSFTEIERGGFESKYRVFYGP